MTAGLAAPWRLAGLVLALALGFLTFYVGAVTPGPAPVDAPAAAFSAERAMIDVRAIGSTPHPVGSPADAKGRDYLLARLGAMGLKPRVQRATSFAAYGPDLSGATVENVIGVLAGRDRAAPALMLMAHRDSVPGSPGAADDSAGVASALEIARAIAAQGTPARDVMLLFTDGEEAGLLGARAFFETDRQAAHVGYVLNLEARGGGGRATMFETARDDGADIALYRRTAAAPVSNALTVLVYRRMPNDTDFTVALAHGPRGFNYAFIGRQFDYHSPSSTPAALDIGAVQHLGAQVLPTALALANGPLPGAAPDVVYANLIGDFTAAYPPAFGWVPLLVAAALIVVGAARAARMGQLSALDIARGAGASLYALAVCGALLMMARQATGFGAGGIPYRPLLARFPLFEVMMLAAGLGGVLAAAVFSAQGRSRAPAAGLALVAGLGAGVTGGGLDVAAPLLGAVGAVAGAFSFAAPARLPGAWTGLLIVALIAGAAVQALAPTAGAVVAWPLLAAAVAAALVAAGARRGVASLGVAALLAALILAWLGGLFHQLLQGLDLPLLAAAPTWLAALAIWPLAFPDVEDRGALWPPVGVILVSLVLALMLRLTDPWTPRHPNAVEPLYVVAPADGRAWRASVPPPDRWTLGVLKGGGGALVKLNLPFERHPLAAVPAPPIPATPPAVTRTPGPDGAVTLTARPHPGAARLWIAIRSPDAIDGASVDGRPADLHIPAGTWGRIEWAGPEGFTLTFHPRDPARVVVATGELFDRWLAATPLPPLPPSDQLWDLGGSTLVIGEAMVKSPG